MALTKKQRAALEKEGLNAAALKKLEGILAADADDDSDSNGDKPKGKGRRVVVYEGDDAESFMRNLFKGDDSDDDADDDAADDADDDDAEPDDKPKGRTRWFG